MPDLFTLTCPALPSQLRVLGFVGAESISRTYRIEVGFSSASTLDFDMDAAIGTRASFAYERSLLAEASGLQRGPMLFHGVVSELELVHEHAERSLYKVVLVPEAWQLELTQKSRIFTDLSVPAIVSKVLRESGVTSFELRLAEAYAAQEHVCQYRESNLAFVSRLLERDGLYWFFEQGAERELLVVTDHKGAHATQTVERTRYYPTATNDVTGVDALRTFACKHAATPARVTMRDYDYRKPDLAVRGSALVGSARTEAAIESSSEVIVYGDNVMSPGEATRRATRRAEQYTSERAVFVGQGSRSHLRAGHPFSVEDHPRPSFNGSYLGISVDHAGIDGSPEDFRALFGREPPATYDVTVRAIPLAVQFRPPLATSWPRIASVVDARIDGPTGGPHAEVDAHGRYKIRLFFDEASSVDGSASTWVRMLQPHGGALEGHHFPLRKGTEVHVLFLGGDPDRPVIAGVAHNATHPSVVTSSNHTQNVLRSGGNNHIVLEDLAGAQFVDVFSPVKNSTLHLGAGDYALLFATEGDAHLDVQGNWDVDVCGEMTLEVTGSVEIKHESYEKKFVAGFVEHDYESTLALHVIGATTVALDSTLEATVTGAASLKCESDVTVECSASVAAHVGGDVRSVFDGAFALTVGGDVTSSFRSSHALGVASDFTHQVGGSASISIAGLRNTVVGGSESWSVGGSLDARIGGPVTWSCPEWTVNTGPTTQTHPDRWEITGLSQTITGASVDVVGASLSATGASASVTGVSLSATGVSLSATGVSLSATGVSGSVTGVDLNQGGPSIHIHAIILLI